MIFKNTVTTFAHNLNLRINRVIFVTITMLSFASVPLASKKVYVPIEAIRFFDVHPNADWDMNKNDVYCSEHNVSFNESTNLQPLVINTNGVYYSGIDLPVTHLTSTLESLVLGTKVEPELNRDYGGCCK